MEYRSLGRTGVQVSCLCHRATGASQGLHLVPIRVGLVHWAAGRHEPDHRPADDGATG
jgi:hypothetical protein